MHIEKIFMFLGCNMQKIMDIENEKLYGCTGLDKSKIRRTIKSIEIYKSVFVEKRKEGLI